MNSRADRPTSVPSLRAPAGGPRRVVRLIARLNTGGAAAPLITQGIRGLPGFEQVLVAGLPEENEVEMEGLLRRLDKPVRYLPDLRRSISLGADRDVIREFVKLLHQIEPDIVETHTAKAGLVGRVAAAAYDRERRKAGRTEARVAHHFHGHVFRGDYFSPIKTRLFLELERFLARHATDAIWTPCQQQVDELVGEFRVGHRAQYRVVPYGIEIDELITDQDRNRRDFRAELGLTEENVVIGLIGRLEPVKDPITFLRGVSAALRELGGTRLGEACRALVIGDGTLRPNVEAESARLGLSEQVRFLGTRQDREHFLAGLDMVALSSVNEGYPVALVEAMAFGKAVVGTAVGGVRELVRHGLTGLLVPPRDPDALGSAIASLVREPERMRELGRGGRSFAHANHDVEHMIGRTTEVYGELLDTGEDHFSSPGASS